MAYGNNAIYCDTPDKIPKGNHWAIILGTSVYIEGDQRSIDYPGHGYPASTNYYTEYRAFLNRVDWEAAITELSESKYGKKSFKAIVVQVAEIKSTVTVNISV